MRGHSLNSDTASGGGKVLLRPYVADRRSGTSRDAQLCPRALNVRGCVAAVKQHYGEHGCARGARCERLRPALNARGICGRHTHALHMTHILRHGDGLGIKQKLQSCR